METPRLDSLYGAGTLTEFSRRIDLSPVLAPAPVSTVREAPTNASGIAVEVVWETPGGEPVGTYRLIYQPKIVITTGLWIEPPFTGKGIITHLIGQLNEWWPTLGITRNLMTPLPGKPREILEACGFHELPSGQFGCVLPDPRLTAFLNRVREGKQKAPPVF